MEKIKEKYPNINKRVEHDTKKKIEELMKRDDLKANELFKEMITLYESKNNDLSNLPNFDNDINELSTVLCYISSIFNNIKNKTVLHLQDIEKSYEEDRKISRLNIENEFREQVETVINEKNAAINEYTLIVKKTEDLLSETQKLRTECDRLSTELAKSSDLNTSYKEQINSLKEHNKMLEEKLSSNSNGEDIEDLKKQHSMEILELKFNYQNQINTIQNNLYNEINLLKDKLNEEKDKYSNLNTQYIELKHKK